MRQQSSDVKTPTAYCVFLEFDGATIELIAVFDEGKAMVLCNSSYSIRNWIAQNKGKLLETFKKTDASLKEVRLFGDLNR